MRKKKEKVAVKYISVSGMRFKPVGYLACKVTKFFVKVIFLITGLIISCNFSYAQIYDHVVAYVMDNAITLSEFNEVFENTKKVSPDITKEEVINTMINRLLLLNEAKKIRLTAKNDDEMIKEYIDIKIRTFVQVRDDEVKQFYENNIIEFKDKPYDDVKDEIERYLIESEVNKMLKKHIEELRGATCIKIQF